jgi:Na+/H+ antiporter NhaB
MGEAINHFFESQMQWSFDNGLIYINGRDITAFIIGFLVCWLIIAIGELLYGTKNRRQN